MMQRLRDALYGVRDELRRLTGIVFWFTLGSLSTMYVVAPTMPLTQQLLPLEIGLLIGMGLVYLSRRQEKHRQPGYGQEKLL